VITMKSIRCSMPFHLLCTYMPFHSVRSDHKRPV
jgi:hypothetical protein